MLVDILAPGAAPISSPLPLAVPLAHDEELAGAADLLPPGSPRGRSAEAGSSGRNAPAAAAQAHQAQGAPELPVSTGSSQPEEPEGAGAAVLAGGPAAGGYALHYPAWLVDGAAGLVYRLQLDLQAIAACQSDACALLAFLQRRRPCAAPRRDAVGISLRVLSGLAQEEAPLGLLRQAFEVVNSVHGAAQQAQRHQQHTPPRSAGSSRPSSAATDRSGAGSGRASPLPQGAGADAASAGSLSPQRQLPAAPQQPRSVVEPQASGGCCCGWAAAVCGARAAAGGLPACCCSAAPLALS